MLLQKILGGGTSATSASGHIVTTKRVQLQQNYSYWPGYLDLNDMPTIVD
jgi:hypothetical protein